MKLNLYPTEAFDVTSSAITLRSLPESVISDLSIDSKLSLKNASYFADPIIKDDVDLFGLDEAKYDPTFARVCKGGRLVYHKDNFNNLCNTGTIKFTVKKADCKNDYAYQTFSGFSEIPAGKYKDLFVITHSNGNPDVRFKGTLTLTNPVYNISDLADLLNAVNWRPNTNNAVRGFEFIVGLGGTLVLKTVYEEGLATTGRIEAEGDLFNQYFTTKSDALVYSAPEVDTDIIKFMQSNSNDSKIAITHRIDGMLYLEMYDESGEYKLEKYLCDWNFTNEEFTEFALNFTLPVIYFMVNGKVVQTITGVGHGSSELDVEAIDRGTNPQTYLKLVDGGDAYDYASLTVYDEMQNSEDYEPGAFDSYIGSYITYDIGDITLYEDFDITINDSGDFTYTILNGTEEIVSSNNWDGLLNEFKEYVKENSTEDEEGKTSLDIEDLIVKIEFDSEGASVFGFGVDQGTGSDSPENPANFDEIYDWVRRKLGYPQVPVELTDSQIYDALTDAIDRYNKWRNWNENLYIADITDNKEKEGKEFLKVVKDHEGTSYIIPNNIADKDIIDIFFQPRYTAAWFGSGSDFINDVVAQTFFSRAIDMSTNAADYYIYRMSLNDISNLIGTQLSWRVYNHRLYITPNDLPLLDQFRLGVRYRESLSVEEIMNSWQIKRLTLANAMITLGMIRGTFTTGIPAGDMTIMLNSDTLISRGNELRTEVENELKKEQKPLFMIWT